MYPQRQLGTKLKFPLQQYFKQLFFRSSYVTILNPFKFWRLYQESHLENCQEQNLALLLERCLKQKIHAAAPPLPNCSEGSLISIKPKSLPIVKLKYRGVTYYRPQILYFSNYYSDSNFVDNLIANDRNFTIVNQDQCDGSTKQV
jgi:hypothetical protein